MAPTKAKARYAVTTPNLLTKGRKAIFKPPKVTLSPAVTDQPNNAFHVKKVSLAVYPPHPGSAQLAAT
jgi:hypothetical protein